MKSCFKDSAEGQTSPLYLIGKGSQVHSLAAKLLEWLAVSWSMAIKTYTQKKEELSLFNVEGLLKKRDFLLGLG